MSAEPNFLDEEDPGGALYGYVVVVCVKLPAAK